jgi:acyl-CoA thioesterase YciA
MEIITQHLCLEKDVGNHGNLFGGIMMAWLDEAGAILAIQKAKTNRMVTVMMDKLQFIQPVKVGDVVRIYGKVAKIGNTSLTLDLMAEAIDPETETGRRVCETHMVFVKLDKWGNKAPITGMQNKE